MNVWLTASFLTHWKEQMLIGFLKKENDNWNENYLPVSMIWVCIKPGIQKQELECRKQAEWPECYIPGKSAMRSRKFPQTFRGMLLHSLGNDLKYFRECLQAFHEISSNNTGNVLKHSGECTETFQGMSPSILRNGSKHYGECRYPMNFARHSGKCFQTFWGMSALLKKMKAQGQSKISRCWFSVWGILRELGGRRVQDSLV